MNTSINLNCTPAATTDGASAPATNRYGLDDIDFGSKYSSNIKDAYRNEEEWAKAIIDAEKAPIARAKYLNPRGFGRNSLYGVMQGGLRVSTRFASPDPTVRDTLQRWARHLNADFSGMKSYTPEQLAQRVVDLDEVITMLEDGIGALAKSGEIARDDVTTWQRVIEGLESYAEAMEKLQEVVSEGPDISIVHLDLDPRQH